MTINGCNDQSTGQQAAMKAAGQLWTSQRIGLVTAMLCLHSDGWGYWCGTNGCFAGAVSVCWVDSRDWWFVASGDGSWLCTAWWWRPCPHLHLTPTHHCIKPTPNNTMSQQPDLCTPTTTHIPTVPMRMWTRMSIVSLRMWTQVPSMSMRMWRETDVNSANRMWKQMPTASIRMWTQMSTMSIIMWTDVNSANRNVYTDVNSVNKNVNTDVNSVNKNVNTDVNSANRNVYTDGNSINNNVNRCQLCQWECEHMSIVPMRMWIRCHQWQWECKQTLYQCQWACEPRCYQCQWECEQRHQWTMNTRH